MSTCWRFSGSFPYYADNREIQVFVCGDNGYFVPSGNPEYVSARIVVNGVAYPTTGGGGEIQEGDDTEFGLYFWAGTESVVQVSSDSEILLGIQIGGDCSACQIKYDCLNGMCVPQTEYGTPGKYNSLAECQQDCGGEDVKFNNISVPVFSQCDASGNPINIQETVSVIAGLESTELLKFQQIADIQGELQCSINVASIPDAWEFRPKFQRSQVIYQFSKLNDSGAVVGPPCYQINVPHHLADKPTNPLPNYRKGNWQIIYVLNDNSKVTINAFDQSNAFIVLNIIKTRIDPEYLTNAYLSRSCPIETKQPYAEIYVKNRLAKYYSTGNLHALPDWIAEF